MIYHTLQQGCLQGPFLMNYQQDQVSLIQISALIISALDPKRKSSKAVHLAPDSEDDDLENSQDKVVADVDDSEGMIAVA